MRFNVTLYLQFLSFFFHLGTENCRASTVVGRCVAIDVVRSTAHSPTLTGNLRDCTHKSGRCHRSLRSSIVRLKLDGTRAETRFLLSPKRISPFKSAGASVQSTAGSRNVRISGSSAGYTTLRGSVSVLTTHSIHQSPLHFPSRGSPCAIRFQTHSTAASGFVHSTSGYLVRLDMPYFPRT